MREINSLIKLEHLKKGDEILIPINSSIAYLRVLRVPALSKNQTGNSVPRYKTLMCSTQTQKVTRTFAYGGHSYTYTKTEYIPTPEDHNVERRFNLNFKSMWLIKRGDED